MAMLFLFQACLPLTTKSWTETVTSARTGAASQATLRDFPPNLASNGDKKIHLASVLWKSQNFFSHPFFSICRGLCMSIWKGEAQRPNEFCAVEFCCCLHTYNHMPTHGVTMDICTGNTRKQDLNDSNDDCCSTKCTPKLNSKQKPKCHYGAMRDNIQHAKITIQYTVQYNTIQYKTSQRCKSTLNS